MSRGGDWKLVGLPPELVPIGARAFVDAPIAGSPGVRFDVDDARSTRDAVDAWARHASATSGFGDGATADDAVIYTLQQAARRRRALAIGALACASGSALRRLAARTLARLDRRRAGRRVDDALQELDDHTLRDLGFDRGDVASMRAERIQEAECARIRIVLTLAGLAL